MKLYSDLFAELANAGRPLFPGNDVDDQLKRIFKYLFIITVDNTLHILLGTYHLTFRGWLQIFFQVKKIQSSNFTEKILIELKDLKYIYNLMLQFSMRNLVKYEQ